MADAFTKVGHFKDVASFAAHLRAIGVDLPVDDRILSAADASPLSSLSRCEASAQSATAGASIRWKAGTARPTGEPTEHTIRRWKHFGESGCKLIWGGEAFAVQSDGRATRISSA